MKLFEYSVLRDMSMSKENIEKPIIGIYFLFSRSTLVYIGSSFDCKKRVLQHINQQEKEFITYTIIPLKYNPEFYKNDKDIKSFLLKIESEYIFKYKPKYNKTLTPNKELQYIGSIQNYKPERHYTTEFSVVNGKVYCKYQPKEK